MDTSQWDSNLQVPKRYNAVLTPQIANRKTKNTFTQWNVHNIQRIIMYIQEVNLQSDHQAGLYRKQFTLTLL